MRTVNTFAQITKLPLGTALYRPTATDIQWWYYAGVNPKSDKSIMLISAGNVQKIHGEYIGDKTLEEPYLLNYQDACKEAIKMAAMNVSKMKKVFAPTPKSTKHGTK